MAGRLRTRSWPVIAARILVLFFVSLYACNFCGLGASFAWRTGKIYVGSGMLEFGCIREDGISSLGEYCGISHATPFWRGSAFVQVPWRERFGLTAPMTMLHPDCCRVGLFQSYPLYILPLWLCAAVPAAFLFISGMRVRRRAVPLPCRACGYSLVGNTSGRCPECGTAICDRTAPNKNGPVASR
ncbi:hypothetical protein B7486_01210 [cyanobacterium TDX16]|nr:hypothetical protein B7486_01210 [cyanobacterium TDX16]